MKRTKTRRRFVVCIKNSRYAASLELRKIYRVLSDAKAAKHGLIRIVDESGEDYLYPGDYFAAIDLPTALSRTLAAVG